MEAWKLWWTGELHLTTCSWKRIKQNKQNPEKHIQDMQTESDWEASEQVVAWDQVWTYICQREPKETKYRKNDSHPKP